MQEDENWLYMDVELLDDHVSGQLPDQDFRTWLYICILLKMHGDQMRYDPAAIAWRIRRTKEQVTSAIEAACSLGLLDLDEDNVLRNGNSNAVIR